MRTLIGTTLTIAALLAGGCDTAPDDAGRGPDNAATVSDEAAPADGDAEPDGDEDAGDIDAAADDQAPGGDEEAASEPGNEDPTGDDLAIGESSTLGDYEVTVTAFVEDATEEVLATNQFNEAPDNGLYGTVTFNATYIGDEEGAPGFDLAAKLVIDGVQHADYDCDASVESGAMDAPTLENGGTATNINFCFDHPGLSADARLFFEETLSFDDTRAYWSAH